MSQDTNQQTSNNTERKPRVYHDFNLRFSGYNEEDGSFKVWVEGETRGGTMRPDDAVKCVYDAKAFWRNPASGRGGLMGSLERRRIGRDDLFKLGQMLSELALPAGQVRMLFLQSVAHLKEGEGLRLRLRIDPVALVHLPWEYMVLSEAAGEGQATDFLALRPEISIVRSDTVEAAERSSPQRAVARVVGVLSSPDGMADLDVEEDQAAINEAVKGLNKKLREELVKVVWADSPATRQALQEALADGADLFHFAGHADFDQFSQMGHIALEKDDYSADLYSGEQLAQLLRGADVRLVNLGACNTGRRDGQNVWSGVAPALTRQKIPAVIANQFKIKDKYATLMAAQLYPLLLAGYTVDEAVFEARAAIYQKAGLEHRDWAAPVLYLHDKTGVLFPLPEVNAESEEAKRYFNKVAIKLRDVVGKGTQVRGFRSDKAPTKSTSVEIEGRDVKDGAVIEGMVIDRLW